MKKSRLTKIIAVILTLTLAFSTFGVVTANASRAYPITGSDNPIGVIFSDIIDTLLNFVLGLFSDLFGDGPGFVPEENVTGVEDNFYEGTGKEFLSEPAENAKWNLGYANASLIPEDYSNGT